jgi:hypothetical protein
MRMAVQCGWCRSPCLELWFEILADIGFLRVVPQAIPKSIQAFVKDVYLDDVVHLNKRLDDIDKKLNELIIIKVHRLIKFYQALNVCM